jgi:hypothetical protein
MVKGEGVTFRTEVSKEGRAATSVQRFPTRDAPRDARVEVSKEGCAAREGPQADDDLHKLQRTDGRVR